MPRFVRWWIIDIQYRGAFCLKKVYLYYVDFTTSMWYNVKGFKKNMKGAAN